MSQITQYWDTQAEHWEDIHPDLKPSPSDKDSYNRNMVSPGAAYLVFGSTSELMADNAVGVDSSRGMIDAARCVTDKGVHINASWHALPLTSGSMANVIGDGSLNVIPAEYQLLVLREAHRVLQHGGRLIVRVYTPEDVMRGNIDRFKVLLGYTDMWGDVALKKVYAYESDRLPAVYNAPGVVYSFASMDQLIRRARWCGFNFLYKATQATSPFPFLVFSAE